MKQIVLTLLIAGLFPNIAHAIIDLAASLLGHIGKETATWIVIILVAVSLLRSR